MAGEIISPPVHVLDFGYQSPNPIDYSRNAFLLGSPVNEAVQHAMEAKNAFLLQQVNAEKQMQVAQWQHSAQLQREAMRDARALKVAETNAASRMALLKPDSKRKPTFTACCSMASRSSVKSIGAINSCPCCISSFNSW